MHSSKYERLSLASCSCC